MEVRLATMCEQCRRNAPLVIFSSSKWSIRGGAGANCLKSMLVCDLRGQVPGYQLSRFEYQCVRPWRILRLCGCVCPRDGSLRMLVKDFFDLHSAVDDELRRNLC